MVGLSRDERIELYLGGVRHLRQAEFAADPKTTFSCHAAEPRENAIRRFMRCPAVVRVAGNMPEERLLMLFDKYVGPVLRLHQSLSINRPFSVVVGDFAGSTDTPAFSKTRGIGLDGLSVLMPLGRRRHLEPIRRVETDDVAFREKQSKVVWRGAMTGSFAAGKPGARFHLVRQMLSGELGKRIDVGFTEIHPRALASFDEQDLAKTLKPKMTMAAQLRNKYLLSLEGNDVASGLKWMLFSNSVVIMPKPRVESWACESRLIPGVHYVQVQDDLSDIQNAFAWCESNQEVCTEISANAKAFIRPLLTDLHDDAIAETLIKKYHHHTKLIMRPKRTEPAAVSPRPQ